MPRAAILLMDGVLTYGSVGYLGARYHSDGARRPVAGATCSQRRRFARARAVRLGAIETSEQLRFVRRMSEIADFSTG